MIGTKGIGSVAKVGKLPDAPKANVPKVTPNTAVNLKSDVLSKVEEVKQQLRQLRTPSYELAGVNVGRITDNGTVGKNTPPSNPKPSTSSKPPQKKITGKSLDSVPSVRNGEFNNWFNSLTSEEFDRVWSDPKLRDKIKDRLRHPGGMHEWHLVSRADTFKYWGVTAEQIAEMRTLISDTKFVNPTGKHGGKGSTRAHNELLQIIDTSKDYDMFKRRLQNWADYRFEGGSDALPDGLKPNRR